MEDFRMILLILNIKVYSPARANEFLCSKEGILECEHDTTIRIPLCGTRLLAGWPVTGEHYSIQYVDGIESNPFGLDFCFVGVKNHELVFSSTMPNQSQAEHQQ